MDIDLPAFGNSAASALSALVQQVGAVLLAPGSAASVSSLACALFIAGASVLWIRRGRRPVSLRLMARALLPRRIMHSRSNRVDLGLFAFNATVYGVLFGWAIGSQAVVSQALLSALGPAVLPAPLIGGAAAMLVGTVGLFLAGELGYYVSHWLSHRVPLLWEFHKVHHSAEVLTPLTNFRVHPVQGLVFANILAVTMGAADAGLTLLLGKGGHMFTVFDRNILALASLYLVQHLHHTHLWLTAPGPLRNIIYSPAHHQIHHSENPAHFGKNLGSSLTLWDWMFGTLHTPSRQRERLTFGLGDEPNHHSVGDAMVRPVAASLVRLRPAPRPSRLAAE